MSDVVALSVTFGLTVMAFWGVSNFLSKVAVQRTGPFRTLLYAQVGSAILTILYALFSMELLKAPPTMEIAALAVAVGAMHVATTFFFYRSMKLGRLSVVAPIAGSSGGVTAVLSMFLFGEMVTFTQGIGIVLALAGIVLISVNLGELRSHRKLLAAGVPEALMAMLLGGITVTTMKPVSAAMGGVWTSAVMRAVTLLLLIAFVSGTRREVSFKVDRKLLLVFVGIGIFDTVGLIALSTGVGLGNASIVAPVASLVPTVSVLLAWIFLKERLRTDQKMGFVAILIALWLIASS
jgi:drug/metabolite transporter (DMT)-like permease